MYLFPAFSPERSFRLLGEADEVLAAETDFKAQGEQLWRLEGKLDRPWEEARSYRDVCQCTVCGEIFSTEANFDRHRARNIAVDERRAEGRYVYDRWCLSEIAMECIGLAPRWVRGVRLWRKQPQDRPFYDQQEVLLGEIAPEAVQEARGG
jgi:hypothetical protein